MSDKMADIEHLKEQFRSKSVNLRYQLISDAVEQLPEELRNILPPIPRDQPEEIFSRIPQEMTQLLVEKINEASMAKIIFLSMLMVI